MANASDSMNQARIGLYAVGAVALSGLVLLMVSEADGGRNWPFNLFLLVAGASVWLYWGVIFRAQQNLFKRVEGSDRSQKEVEGTLVSSLDRLRAGDLVNC